MSNRLAPAQREGLVSGWYDSRKPAGQPATSTDSTLQVTLDVAPVESTFLTFFLNTGRRVRSNADSQCRECYGASRLRHAPLDMPHYVRVLCKGRNNLSIL